MLFFQSQAFLVTSQILIGSVWVFHGLYSKLLDGIPRHRLIVGRILGEAMARPACKLIGMLEVLVGLWIYTGWLKMPCAVLQTLALFSMNVLEIALARDLLVSAAGMVILNLGLLALVWNRALSGG
jgi:hypothetical protein